MIIEVKPSAKWDPHWWDITEDENTPLGRARGVNEDIYYSPLSQLNFYMAHSGVDYAGPIYGVLLTDQYLIPVKRDGFIYGALATGQPIPWSTYFENGQEISGFTVQSALWYLSMLSGMPGWHYRGDEALREVRNDMQVFKAHHSKQEK